MIQPKQIAPPAPNPMPDPAAPPSAPPGIADPNAANPNANPDAAGKPPAVLPDKLLHLPAMQALMAGNPPAVSVNIKTFEKNPAAKLISSNKDLLLQAGMGFYRSLSGSIGVIFNQMHIHPADLQAADRAGKLGLIAPSFDVVDHAVHKSGVTNPVLNQHHVPNGFKPAMLPQPPQIADETPPGMAPGATGNPPAPMAAPSVKPPAASIQRKIMGQRVKNLSPGAPTSGSQPGAGRLMNQIMQPVV